MSVELKMILLKCGAFGTWTFTLVTCRHRFCPTRTPCRRTCDAHASPADTRSPLSFAPSSLRCVRPKEAGESPMTKTIFVINYNCFRLTHSDAVLATRTVPRDDQPVAGTQKICKYKRWRQTRDQWRSIMWVTKTNRSFLEPWHVINTGRHSVNEIIIWEEL